MGSVPSGSACHWGRAEVARAVTRQLPHRGVEGVVRGEAGVQQFPEVTYSTSALESYTADSKSSVRLRHLLLACRPAMSLSSARPQVRPVPPVSRWEVDVGGVGSGVAAPELALVRTGARVDLPDPVAVVVGHPHRVVARHVAEALDVDRVARSARERMRRDDVVEGQQRDRRGPSACAVPPMPTSTEAPSAIVASAAPNPCGLASLCSSRMPR